MKIPIVRVKMIIKENIEEKMFILRGKDYIPVIIPTGQSERVPRSKVKEHEVIGEIELPDYCAQSLKV